MGRVVVVVAGTASVVEGVEGTEAVGGGAAVAQAPRRREKRSVPVTIRIREHPTIAGVGPLQE